MSAGRWLWVAASVALASHGARAERFACPVCAQHLEHRDVGRATACPTTTAGVRGWIHGEITTVTSPTYRCEASEPPIDDPDVLLGRVGEHPDATTGCIILAGAPACDGVDRVDRTTIGIDGVARDVPAAVGMTWKACGLSPGRHQAMMCTPRGAASCAIDVWAGTATSQLVVPVDAELHVHVDRVYVGDASLLGRDLAFRYAVDADWSGQLGLPKELDLAWTGTEPTPRAMICAPPNRLVGPPPVASNGCAHCDGGGSAGGAATLAVFGWWLLRRRR